MREVDCQKSASIVCNTAGQSRSCLSVISWQMERSLPPVEHFLLANTILIIHRCRKRCIEAGKTTDLFSENLISRWILKEVVHPTCQLRMPDSASPASHSPD
jgi:hypothetical protein